MNKGLFKPTVMFFGMCNWFTSNILIYDGQHLYYHDWRKTGDCLHGQHPHICWDKRRTHTDHKNGTGETMGKQFIPQGQEMQISQDKDWISRHDHQRRKNFNGPCQTWRNKRLANPYHGEASMIFPGIWKLLQKVHISLLQTCLTSEWPDKERQEIWMDHQMPRSVWHLKMTIHWRTSIVNAWPIETIPNWIRHVKSGNRSSTYSTGFEQWPNPVAFMDTERRYEIYDTELLGIIWALKEWRHYIHFLPMQSLIQKSICFFTKMRTVSDHKANILIQNLLYSSYLSR